MTVGSGVMNMGEDHGMSTPAPHAVVVSPDVLAQLRHDFPNIDDQPNKTTSAVLVYVDHRALFGTIRPLAPVEIPWGARAAALV